MADDDARAEAEAEALRNERRAMRQRTELVDPSPLLLRVRLKFRDDGGAGDAFDWAVNGYVRQHQEASRNPVAPEVDAIARAAHDILQAHADDCERQGIDAPRVNTLRHAANVVRFELSTSEQVAALLRGDPRG